MNIENNWVYALVLIGGGLVCAAGAALVVWLCMDTSFFFLRAYAEARAA